MVLSSKVGLHVRLTEKREGWCRNAKKKKKGILRNLCRNQVSHLYILLS